MNARIKTLGMDMRRVSAMDIKFAYEDIIRASTIQGGKMIVYRGMNVEESWIDDLALGARLGKYWAYDQQGAHDGSWDEPNIVFKALVDLKDIDWAITVAQEIAVGGEYEIKMANAQVTMVHIKQIPTATRDFSNLIGQIFWT